MPETETAMIIAIAIILITVGIARGVENYQKKRRKGGNIKVIRFVWPYNRGNK